MSISPSARGNSSSGRVQIGRIIGAHGIRGEIRVHPTTDYPERFLNMRTLFAEHPAKPPMTLAVTGVRFHDGKGQILVTAEGVTDRDAAESLRGRAITVAPDERVELPEGEYWIDSLIGLGVIESDGGARLGKIEEVMNTGNNDVYMIRTADGELKLIPAIADVIEEISLERGEMRVNLPEGLWD